MQESAETALFPLSRQLFESRKGPHRTACILYDSFMPCSETQDIPDIILKEFSHWSIL